MVSQLLSAGAHRHVLDNSGLTPLMVAVHGAEMMDGENTIEVVTSIILTSWCTSCSSLSSTT